MVSTCTIIIQAARNKGCEGSCCSIWPASPHVCVGCLWCWVRAFVCACTCVPVRVPVLLCLPLPVHVRRRECGTTPRPRARPPLLFWPLQGFTFLKLRCTSCMIISGKQSCLSCYYSHWTLSCTYRLASRPTEFNVTRL